MFNSIARLTTRINVQPFVRACSAMPVQLARINKKVGALSLRIPSPPRETQINPFHEFIINNPEIAKECGGNTSKMRRVFDAYSKMSANHEANVAKGNNPSTIL